MNPLRADFAELYRRHLCRHSQWQINLLHLVAVGGVYFSLMGLVLALPGGSLIATGVLAIYFAILAPNLPGKVWLANGLAVAIVLALFLATPPIPWWAHILLILWWHRFQNWNHRKYDVSYDMSEFARKYRKGPALFLLLSIYELPILLFYVLFDRRPEEARVAALMPVDTPHAHAHAP
jgi:hypothetical protein